MKLIVISAPEALMGERDTMFQLFDLGLEKFHLRKPNYSPEKVANFLNVWPKELREKTVIHKHRFLAEKYKLGGLHHGADGQFETLNGTHPLTQSKSIHSLEELGNIDQNYDYTFLSPIFDSISKSDYKAAFSKKDIEKALETKKNPVYALGGINSTTALEAKKLGFDGVAILGTIWDTIMHKKLIEEFKRIQDICA